jgi:hypothetical protein
MVMVGQGEANTLLFVFQWLESGDNADVTDGSSVWNVVAVYWLHSFGSVGSQAVELV